MPEPYQWEWLKQPSDESTEAEQNAHQLKNLRRWIDPIDTESSDDTISQVDTTQHSHRLSRRQRLRQLKQMQANPGLALPDITMQHQPSAELQQPVQLLSEHEIPLTQPGAFPPHEPLPEQPTQQPTKNGAKKMAKKDDYREHLKQEFNTLFENLSLQPQQKHYLKSRWLDQVLWMEGRAGKARDMHYRLRLTTIVGGVIIPALVSLNFTGSDQIQFKQAIAASTFVLSQAVAICAATEQFFNYGDRWRHYRRSVESLKTQGWQFFELTGPYENSKTHEQAFNIFANQVEQILQHDVEIYSTQVAQAKQNEKQEEEQSANPSAVNGRIPDVTTVRQP